MRENTLREYEFTYIARADLGEADKTKLINKYEKLLTDGGEVLRKDDWGIKRLAFPIKKQYKGHYFHYDFVGKAENVAEAERLMRIDEGILRFLAINVGEDIDVAERKDELAKMAARAQARAQEAERERN